MAKKLNLLAFDLGASNGRTILGKYNGTKLELEEVHKFPNGAINIQGSLYWNTLGLFEEIKTGLRKAIQATDNNLACLAIDTWGVDYGLLDKEDNLLTNPYHYRDSRTDGLLDEIFAQVSAETIYQLTGIQFMQINTLVQLYADLLYRPWILENAKSLLFMPDLLNFFLTGKKFNEYTNSSTSQLFNPTTTAWADELFTKLNLPREIMQPLIFPGEIIGELTDDLKVEFGIDYSLPVVAVGSHDTASAVAATPLLTENSIYISSGTWSLLGMELTEPVITEASRRANFTNECGVGKTIRFLKNISGLWLIQECKRSWDRQGLNLSYDQISEAATNTSFASRIDPDDPSFLNPADMPTAIKEFCKRTNQAIPETYGEIARCVYESLASSYKRTLDMLEVMIDTTVDTIHMVGGGIQAEILCQFTANSTGKKVVTGPIEATAMGNMLVQLMAMGEISSLAEGREIIKRSVTLKEYLPL